MTNLTTIQTTHAAGFAHRERREVVVEDKALGVFTTRVVVEILLLVCGSESADAESLSLSAREDGGTVHTWQGVHFTVKRAKITWGTAIGAHALFHDGNAKRLLLDVFKDLLDFEIGGLGHTLEDGGFHFVAQRTNLLGAFSLGGCVDGVLDAVTGNFVADLQEVFLGNVDFELALGLAGHGHQFFLGGDDLADRFLSGVEGFDEVFFGKLIGLTFDHDDVGLVANVDQVEVGLFTLLVSGVDDELTTNATDAHRTDRAGEGDVGEAECGGSAVHGEHVGIVHAVGGKKHCDDLSVVEVTLGEERTQGAVRHAAGEDFLLGGTAFTLEVATGENTSCRSLFLVFDRERKPALAGLDLGLGDSGDENDGVAATNGYCAVREFGKFAGFDRHRIGADFDRLTMDVHGFRFLLFHTVVTLSPIASGHFGSELGSQTPTIDAGFCSTARGIQCPEPAYETATGTSDGCLRNWG